MNKLVIYTDISYKHKSKNLTLGLVILQNNRIIETFRCDYTVPKKGSLEVFGLKKAIIHVKKNYNFDYLKIRVEVLDYIYKLNSRKGMLKDFRTFVGSRGEITWVKAHYNNPYNILADKLCDYRKKQTPEKILNSWYKNTRFNKSTKINRCYIPISLKF